MHTRFRAGPPAVLLTMLALAGACAEERDGTLYRAAFEAGVAEASLSLTSDWNAGYCAEVTISNLGTEAITNWGVTLDFHQSTPSQIWNGSFSGDQANPAGHNARIQPNGSTSFGFCASKSGNDYVPEIIGLPITGGGSMGGSASAGGSTSGGSEPPPEEPPPEEPPPPPPPGDDGTTGGSEPPPSDSGSVNGDATLNVNNDWGSGYCATVTREGSGGSWTTVLDLNGTRINNLWNGSVTSNGDQATVRSSQASFGFCANGSADPEIVSVQIEGGSDGGGTTSGGSTSGGSNGDGGDDGANGDDGSNGDGGGDDGGVTPPPITGGQNGYATRFWDCCKPHCGWSSNVPGGMQPMESCSMNDDTLSSFDVGSSCSGGGAFMCQGLSPWAINGQLAYGYAATSSGDVCGKCYQLEFTGEGRYGRNPGAEALRGKTMIVQAVNIGYDVSGGQFDILVPGGGVGQFNACSTQWGVSNDELGAQYGGFLTACQGQLGYNASLDQYKSCVRSRCDSVFGSRGLTDLRDGCYWFADWFQAADNPNVRYQEVQCPPELEGKSGMSRP